MFVGAIALVLLNFATLALSGRPWGVTSAFALWGAKIFAALGIDVANWPYWAAHANAGALAAPVTHDVTSVMDIGIILGAMTAAALAGRYAPVWKVPARSLIAAVVGGLMLGYGARLAYGCNIGAYFSGIVSGSLHGWLWLVAAFAGNVLGTRLRPAVRPRSRTDPRKRLLEVTNAASVCNWGRINLLHLSICPHSSANERYLLLSYWARFLFPF